MTSVRPDPSWMARGACVGADPAIWFPERGDTSSRAKAICASCEVRAECRDHAINYPELFGLWGGLSQRELARLRRGRRRKVCRVCGDLFPPSHSAERYCSEDCRAEGRSETERRYQARYRTERRSA